MPTLRMLDKAVNLASDGCDFHSSPQLGFFRNEGSNPSMRSKPSPESRPFGEWPKSAYRLAVQDTEGICVSGGTGIRTSLRNSRLRDWGFDSLLAHHFVDVAQR